MPQLERPTPPRLSENQWRRSELRTRGQKCVCVTPLAVAMKNEAVMAMLFPRSIKTRITALFHQYFSQDQTHGAVVEKIWARRQSRLPGRIEVFLGLN